MPVHQPRGQAPRAAERDQQGRTQQAVEPAPLQHPVQRILGGEGFVTYDAQTEAAAQLTSKGQHGLPAAPARAPALGELLDTGAHPDEALGRPQIEFGFNGAQYRCRRPFDPRQGGRPAEGGGGSRPTPQARGDPAIGDLSPVQPFQGLRLQGGEGVVFTRQRGRRAQQDVGIIGKAAEVEAPGQAGLHRTSIARGEVRDQLAARGDPAVAPEVVLAVQACPFEAVDDLGRVEAPFPIGSDLVSQAAGHPPIEGLGGEAVRLRLPARGEVAGEAAMRQHPDHGRLADPAAAGVAGWRGHSPGLGLSLHRRASYRWEVTDAPGGPVPV